MAPRSRCPVNEPAATARRAAACVVLGLALFLLGATTSPDGDTEFEAGLSSFHKHEHLKAAAHFQAALEIDARSRPAFVPQNALMAGRAWLAQGSAGQALRFFERSLNSARDLGRADDQAIALIYQGMALRALGRIEPALAALVQGRALAAKSDNFEAQAKALLALGQITYQQRRTSEASRFFEEAEVFARRANNAELESNAFSARALVAGMLGNDSAARAFYDAAIDCARRAKNRDAEGEALGNFALLLASAGELEKARSLMLEALEIRRSIHDRRGEGIALNNLGETEASLGLYSDAVTHLSQSLRVALDQEDYVAEAARRNNLGKVYRLAGQLREAMLEFKEAERIQRARDLPGRHISLNNQAAVLLDQDDLGRAIVLLEEAERRGEGDPAAKASIVNSLGVAYRKLKRFDEAERAHLRAFEILRSSQRPVEQAVALNNLAVVRKERGKLEPAATTLDQALALAAQTGDQALNAAIYNNLMIVWQARGDANAAILFGKQAVNTYQQLRRSLSRWTEQTRNEFLNSRANAYRVLADLLISERRLPEAIQVLNYLKQEDLSGLIERTGQESTLALTPEEQAWRERYRQIEGRLMEIARRRRALEGRADLREEERQELKKLGEDLAVASRSFQEALEKIATESSSVRPSAELSALRELEALQEDLAGFGPNAVLLHTAVTPERCHVILTTPDAQRAATISLSATELDRRVIAFRQLVRSPRYDPRPLGQELFRVFLGPLTNDLAQAGARTLIWSLDGALRFLPFGALHDGEQYLAEKYQLGIVTLGSLARMKDQPASTRKILAAGITEPLQGFAQLPAVEEEIRNAVAAGRDSQVLMNREFTYEKLAEALRRKPSLVHLASHFHYSIPASESFLLLGDGSQWTLRRIKEAPRLFASVDLLTLSACDTASAGGGATDLEGLAAVAQQKGARAVIGTLWPVADESTAFFMGEFYRQLARGASKAEALQQAQGLLLKGAVAGRQVALTSRSAAPVGGLNDAVPGTAPRFAHPYYWAPFVLIGNLK